MANDLIRYDLRVQDALRGAIRKVLAEAAKDGLPGEHHFQITFRTDAPGVRLSTEMRRRFPQEMTIILQYQFRELSVSDHAVEVVLFFNHIPERILIPFDAISGFFDPSVDFGLRFDVRADAPEAPPVAVRNAPPRLVPKKPQRAEPVRGAGSEPVETRAQRAPQKASAADRLATSIAEGRSRKEAEEARPPGDGKIIPVDFSRRKP